MTSAPIAYSSVFIWSRISSDAELARVARDQTVGQEEHPVRDRGGAGIVRDHDDRLAELVRRPPQEREDVRARLRVEVAGRLVGEDHGGLGQQRTRDRNTLLLAAGELGRPVRSPVHQADGLEQLTLPLRIGLASGDRQRQLDVLLRRQHRQEVEELEDEPDLVAPQPGELLVVQADDLGAVDLDRSRGGLVETGEDVHERRLPRAGRAHDRRELALRELGRDSAQRIDGGVPLAVASCHVLRDDDGLTVRCFGGWRAGYHWLFGHWVVTSHRS